MSAWRYPVSVLAVCTMFGAGIATAFALQAAGVRGSEKGFRLVGHTTMYFCILYQSTDILIAGQIEIFQNAFVFF